MLSDTIQRIAELQKSWSSANTPEMEERGILIRQTMVEELEAYRDEFSRSLSSHGTEYGSDLGIKGRDGTGNKVPAPWVRIFSDHMSPKPNTGFYLVFHFSINGEHVYITLGCGATKDDQKMTQLPESELKRRTTLGRTILDDAGESYSEFNDVISLGESTRLARSFELATVIAKKYDTQNIDVTEFVKDTNAALILLSRIYVGQAQGKHLSPSEIISAEVDTVLNPTRRSRRGQGYGLTATERRAVELRAMEKATVYLESEGFKVKDTSAEESYDILASKDDQKVKVEVKGTTSKRADSILMTRNEVELHKSPDESTALIIVCDINLKKGREPEAKGGRLEVFFPWDISTWEITPSAYQVSRK